MHIIISSIIILIIISIIVLAVIFDDVITGKTFIKTARLYE